jgi:hypothetical protein
VNINVNASHRTHSSFELRKGWEDIKVLQLRQPCDKANLFQFIIFFRGIILLMILRIRLYIHVLCTPVSNLIHPAICSYSALACLRLQLMPSSIWLGLVCFFFSHIPLDRGLLNARNVPLHFVDAVCHSCLCPVSILLRLPLDIEGRSRRFNEY